MLDRARCLDLDRDDPLGPVRERFHLPEDVVYLDGNSLGPPPREALRRVGRAIEEEWGRGLVSSWNDAGWFEASGRIAGKLAPILGARPGEVAVADTISVNLYKVGESLRRLAPARPRVVVEREAFPTDRYVATEVFGRENVVEIGGPGDLDAALDDGVGVVLLSHVDYRSARLWDLEATTRRVHDAGAFVVWDLAHSAGVVPLRLHAAGVDAAVGCTYKYLDGGPGAPGFVFVHERLAERLRQPIAGWWGHADPFAFEPDYRPAPGAVRFQTGTPPILSLVALETALDAVADVDWNAVREKSIGMCRLFVERVEAIDAEPRQEVVGPADPEARGSHVSLRSEAAWPIVRALQERGVVGDFRAPDLARFGFSPLILRWVDVWDAADRLAEVLETGLWREERFAARRPVT